MMDGTVKMMNGLKMNNENAFFCCLMGCDNTLQNIGFKKMKQDNILSLQHAVA